MIVVDQVLVISIGVHGFYMASAECRYSSSRDFSGGAIALVVHEAAEMRFDLPAR